VPNMTDYDATRAAFTWDRPRRYNFARDVVDAWSAAGGENTAMVWVDDTGDERRYAFREVAEASCRLAHVLTDAGVRRGDTVIVLLPRVPEWWFVFTAILRIGAVCSPGTVQLSARDLAYRIDTAEATAIVTDSTGVTKVDEIAAGCPTLKARLAIDPPAGAGWIDLNDAAAGAPATFETVDTASDDDALCYFTSGTTGYPKMCIHTHAYAIGHRVTGRYWLDLTPDDLHWNISDTGWAKAAWSSYFGPWNQGAAVFVHHAAGFDAKRTLELLSRYPITTMCGAPTIYRMLVLEPLGDYRFEHLRHAVSAGEPLNPEIIETWRRATNIVIRDGYGQTETVILCGSFLCFEPRFGSMGRPAPGIELAVVDDAGHEVAPGTEGDIAVCIEPEPPQGLFREYRGEPKKTAATRRGPWYVTGDRAYMDTDGYFWFVSRADDVILSAGYRIGPFEVESALIEHPAVAESAVVSSPDETRGEVVKAFVVLAPGHEPSDALAEALKSHVKTVTAPYKYPRKIEFVPSLPKTVSGKIRRIELREREWRRTIE